MALNNVTFIRTEGGLGSPLPGRDHYSAMLFYTDTLPSGFGSTDRIKKLFSLQDAIDLGIVSDHSDETKATGGNVLITLKGATGDVETITFDGAVLGSYTILSSDADADAVATGLRAAINALTLKHGWTAAGAGANVLLTRPDGMGAIVGVIAFTSSGTGTATVTQDSGGVGSYFAVMHYHIKEFFRQQPKGVLWVGIYEQGSFDGTEIASIQNYANGEIRQLSIYLSHETFATSHIVAIQAKCDILEVEKKPLSVLLHSDMSSATLATLSDLNAQTAKNVSVILGEEGDYLQAAYLNTKSYLAGEKVIWAGNVYKAKKSTLGNAPWNNTYWVNVRDNLKAISGFSISTLGCTLGTVAVSRVHECIAWVDQYNLVAGDSGLDEVGFATGDLWNNVSTSLKDTINDYRYIFIRKFQGRTGTYFNDSFTAISATSDYAYIERNRVIDKVERNVYAEILGLLNSPVYVNANGTLTQDTIDLFVNRANKPIEDMERSGEISAFKVDMNPVQDVLATSEIELSIVNIPVGVARNITIKNGFTTQIV